MDMCRWSDSWTDKNEAEKFSFARCRSTTRSIRAKKRIRYAGRHGSRFSDLSIYPRGTEGEGRGLSSVDRSLLNLHQVALRKVSHKVTSFVSRNTRGKFDKLLPGVTKVAQDLIEESGVIADWCRVSSRSSEIDTNFCSRRAKFQTGDNVLRAATASFVKFMLGNRGFYIRVYPHTEEYKIDIIIKKREKEKGKKPLRGDIDVTGGVQEGWSGWG